VHGPHACIIGVMKFNINILKMKNRAFDFDNDMVNRVNLTHTFVVFL